MSQQFIAIKGARQNNLKNLDLNLPLNELIVVTGVSGSGKSTLAFDTIYAEGQRRYVETFSAYARQFLDRMDKPAVDSIEGIPPAIAIDQSNPVRTSRSTVGTMTELNDYLKLLFARLSKRYCDSCGDEVSVESAQSIVQHLFDAVEQGDLEQEQRIMVCLPILVPPNFSDDEVLQLLSQQGYTRVHARQEGSVEVVQDRLKLSESNRDRLSEAVEVALHHGQGRVVIYPLEKNEKTGELVAQSAKPFSSHHHCARCDLDFPAPSSGLFSFNSPIGACEDCKGFGRIIGVDKGLVIPDESLSLADGAIKPFQTESNKDLQQALMRFAKKQKIPTTKAWRDLTEQQRQLVFEGKGDWIGVRGFFNWLESKSYKMHVRVLLSKYRSYTTCKTCLGARLKPEALWWRVGDKVHQDGFVPQGCKLPAKRFAQIPGLTIHDVMQLPLEDCAAFFDELVLPEQWDEAGELVIGEIRSRLRYLLDVGLGYLTLDRQSRTLSGGEVQRINLTTALGTSLVNTLFVLDEPSIGLHPRDMNRMVKILHRLRDAGNTLLVVEHDPQVMLAADRIIDIGPGPGKQGGEISFFGTPNDLLQQKNSLTADYLKGAKQVNVQSDLEKNTALEAKHFNSENTITVTGAKEHNLQNIDVTFPLNGLVCITGVSGSGKSTLMRDVLYGGLCKHKGKTVETVGVCDDITGHDNIADVVMVDQSPIGKTTRSIPATYVGAFDAIRKLFVAHPVAKERGYTAGTFSFNSGNGRCPTCSGNGFEHVEMQFLSDVYLRCPDCDGKRYRAEILEIKIQNSQQQSQSIADILEMTVSEAVAFFADHKEVLIRLQPLIDVGLSYVQLGQAVPTLSGGEAQRLKLAGHLAETAEKAAKQARKAKSKKASTNKTDADDNRGILFLFDEPTTGLHFDDIATLMKAFQQLIQAGHSLLVIEHNVDVMLGADWIIDIGPEGGTGGGQLVAQGTPEQLSAATKKQQTHTTQALAEYIQALSETQKQSNKGLAIAESSASYQVKTTPANTHIEIHHAREHNLKNVDLSIPRDQFTVISGVSGSGKSTVAFDIIFAEGQRRYLESLNAYARQFVQPASKPDVDAIYGISPTVAIEQRTSRGGRKSTVATMTEIYHYLRLLYVKLGQQHCPDCGDAIESQSVDAMMANLLKHYRGSKIGLLAPMVVARKGIYKELAQWADAKGYQALRVDGEYLPVNPWPQLDRYKEHSIELPVAECVVKAKDETELRQSLETALSIGNGVVIITELEPLKVKGQAKRKRKDLLLSTERACPSCGTGFDELDPRLFSYNSKHGWCGSCYGTGVTLKGFDAEQTGEEDDWLASEAEQETGPSTCKSCDGKRLNETALAVTYRKKSIADLTAMSVEQAVKWFDTLKLSDSEAQIAKDLLVELKGRLSFLHQVGLHYLTLDRAAPTLSGGEAQRIRLASQLGSQLQGVCYVLDEPTIGLHTRDNLKLISTLRELQQKGNTVVVVEHDEDTIREADYVIDMGPRAGVNGGEKVAAGTVKEITACKESLTGQFLANPLRHPMPDLRDEELRAQIAPAHLSVVKANTNNLQNLDVDIPLHQLVAISGVSGSGKSSLIRSVLYKNLATLISTTPGKKASNKTAKSIKWAGCERIENWQSIDRILQVDQTPIGKTTRSCPATYLGVWDTIRKLFADTVDARLRGYTPARFSFNTGDGRCSACGGHGMRKVEMNFLPDVRVECEQCHGWRFNNETLSVRYKDKHIGEVLAMNMEEAASFFESIPSISHVFTLMQDVGLGYLTLGQQSPTLSGGEAQRIKLVTELAKAKPGARVKQHVLYVLDEPTVGLHMADVEKLLRVMHRLVDQGHSVWVIEHNLDVIAEADWVIDIGPEGGAGGGKVVAQGTPQTMTKRKRSQTGHYLKTLLSY